MVKSQFATKYNNRKLSRASFLMLLATISFAGSAVADSATPADRDALFQQTLKHPKDVPLAFAFVQASVELHDYEGAIGALERLQFFAPNDPHIKAELGFLYQRLQSHQMARQYFDAALAMPDLDEGTRGKIASAGPATDAGTKSGHVFGTLQAGARYQTNAAFNPDNNTLRISNQDYVFNNPQVRGPDGNSFQAVQVGYDYDLDNQRGDTVETRFTGYATQQFRFTSLNVGLYDVSIGPRLALAPDALPGWTVKPYVTGGQVFLAGSRYLASGGAGIVADLPVGGHYTIEPGAEVRHVQFSNVSAFSSLNSGSTATLSLAAQANFNETYSAFARFFYMRDAADADFQSSNSFAEEFAVVARFKAPLPWGEAAWSVSPYVKLLQFKLDAPNPLIDVSVTRRDSETQVGVVLDTPLSASFGLITNIQYARVASNIPNYRLHNFSILTGPAVRF